MKALGYIKSNDDVNYLARFGLCFGKTRLENGFWKPNCDQALLKLMRASRVNRMRFIMICTKIGIYCGFIAWYCTFIG